MSCKFIVILCIHRVGFSGMGGLLGDVLTFMRCFDFTEVVDFLFRAQYFVRFVVLEMG